MTSSVFYYNKTKVIQALRYHFMTRREIRLIMIMVNIFAIASASLFFFKKISPLAFLMGSVLWITLMIAFWFILPYSIYNKAQTFKDHFAVTLGDQHLFLENEKGSKSWPWTAFSNISESPNFFHLYFDSRSFFLVPKEAFTNEVLDDVRTEFKLKIKKQD